MVECKRKLGVLVPFPVSVSRGVYRGCGKGNGYGHGVTVQDILQDPNGPRLVDCIDQDLIAASRMAPIDFGPSLNFEREDLDEVLEKLSEGRFIVRENAPTREEARALVMRVRRYG